MPIFIMRKLISTIVSILTGRGSKSGNPDLEKRLKVVLTNVSDRLSQSEIEDEQYGGFIFDKLKQQEILSGDYGGDNAWWVGHYIFVMGRKLNVKTEIGLHYNYRTRSNTPISVEARDDIDQFNELSERAFRYLQEQIKGPISIGDFDSLISDYVESHVPEDVDRDKKIHLVGWLMGTYGSKFKIVPKTEIIGGYSKDEIGKAIARAKVN